MTVIKPICEWTKDGPEAVGGEDLSERQSIVFGETERSIFSDGCVCEEAKVLLGKCTGKQHVNPVFKQKEEPEEVGQAEQKQMDAWKVGEVFADTVKELDAEDMVVNKYSYVDEDGNARVVLDYRSKFVDDAIGNGTDPWEALALDQEYFKEMTKQALNTKKIPDDWTVKQSSVTTMPIETINGEPRIIPGTVYSFEFVITPNVKE